MELAQVVKIFFSYASSVRQDKILFNALINHLTTLRSQGYIETWYDSAITAGSNREQVIDTFISNADIIVLLISADFLASEYYKIELKRAFERGESGAIRVVSVLLRPTDWFGLPIDKFRLLPPNGKPVSTQKNRDVALSEVARGIRKVVEELLDQFKDSFSHKGDRKSPLWKVPYRQNPFFTGREDLLKELHDYFTSGHAHISHMSIMALRGLGGIGKTQIAIEYAYRYHHEYQAVLWLQADSRDLFTTDIITFADSLSLPEKALGEEHIFHAVKRWLQFHDAWLLILDNIEDLTLIDLLLPPQYSGHVLLTTRFQATGSIAHALTIPSMTINEGALFLLRRAKIIGEQASLENASASDHTQATFIAQEVDGFPLALDQAGAYIEEIQGSLTQYLALYHQQRSALLQIRGPFADGHPQSVTATLTLAFEKVAESNPTAMDLLYLFSFLHPEAIPDEMISQGAIELNGPLQKLATDPLELNKALKTLFSFSLVHRQADTTTLSIHRLVQEVLRDKLSQEQQRQWATSVIRLVNQVFPEVDFNTWHICYRYLSHAQICARYVSEYHLTLGEAAQLLYRLGSYCYERAQYSEAETHLAHALHLTEQKIPPEQIKIAQNLNFLALVYNRQGNYQQAETFQQRALAIHEQVLGSEHPATANALNNLALIHQEQGKYESVESLYKRVLAIQESALGINHPDTVTTLNNLGLLYQEQGKYTLAKPLYQQVLAIRESILSPGHPDIAQSLNNLGRLYLDEGNYQQAEALFQRALGICEQTLEANHTDTAQSLNNLALVYRMQKKYHLAEPLYQQAIDIYERIFGFEHPDLAQALNNLALLYRLQGNYQQAQPLYLRALTAYQKALGPDHPDTALSLNNLGRFYCVQGLYEQAQPYLEQAITICEQKLGPDHPDTALCLSNLAEIYTFQHKHAQAYALHVRALSIYKRALGPDHLDVATAMDKYALLLEQIQKAEEAAELRQAASLIRETEKHSTQGGATKD